MCRNEGKIPQIVDKVIKKLIKVASRAPAFLSHRCQIEEALSQLFFFNQIIKKYLSLSVELKVHIHFFATNSIDLHEIVTFDSFSHGSKSTVHGQ